jgi:hypothetical protein
VARPPSIIRYERLYLLAFALGLVRWAVDWNTLTHRLLASPLTREYAWFVPASLAVSITVTMTLWYFTARRPALAAKWIVVLLAAAGAIRVGFNVPAMTRGLLSADEIIVSAVTTLLSLWAAAMLFRADSREWFGEDLDGDES